MGAVAGDGEATRERLIEAGERLFAQKGVNGVTVAEIHAAAHQKNASALHYHFGSRQGLLIAVIERHQRELDGLRSELLDKLDETAGPGRLRQLVTALASPQAMKLRTKRGRNYLRLVPQVMHLGAGADDASMVSQSLARAIGLLRDELDDLSPDLAHHRVDVVLHAIASSMSARATARERGKPDLSDEAFVEDLVSMMTASLCSPTGGR